MSEKNKEVEKDFNIQLKEYIEKYPTLILSQIEDIHSIAVIREYFEAKKKENKNSRVSTNTYLKISIEFYDLMANQNYCYTSAIKKIKDTYFYKNDSSVSNHLQRFKKHISTGYEGSENGKYGYLFRLINENSQYKYPIRKNSGGVEYNIRAINNIVDHLVVKFKIPTELPYDFPDMNIDDEEMPNSVPEINIDDEEIPF